MFFAGNKKLIEENNIRLQESIRAVSEKFQSEAKTVVYFADEQSIVAVIAIADKIKESAKTAVQTLLQQGIEVHMLTGDNLQTAKPD